MSYVLLIEGSDAEGNAQLRYQLLCAKHAVVAVPGNRRLKLPLGGLPRIVLMHAVEPDRRTKLVAILRAVGLAMPIVILAPSEASDDRRYRLTVDCGALSASDVLGMLEAFAQLPLVSVSEKLPPGTTDPTTPAASAASSPSSSSAPVGVGVQRRRAGAGALA